MSLFNFLHILAGTIAVLAGAVALCITKGSASHRLSGQIFAVSMLITASLGALLGLLDYEKLSITFFAGALACYLVASGWLTVRQSVVTPGWREASMTALAAAITVALLISGWMALRQQTGSAFGFPAEDYFLLAIMTSIAVVGDCRLFLRGRLVGPARLERHLWRMGLGLFIAVGSLFTGPGASAFPSLVRETGLLAMPELLIALTMVYWLVKLKFGARRAAAHKAWSEQ